MSKKHKPKVKPMDSSGSGSGGGEAGPDVTLEWAYPAGTNETGTVLSVTQDGTPAGQHIIEGQATEYGPIANPDNADIRGVARPIGQPVDALPKP